MFLSKLNIALILFGLVLPIEKSYGSDRYGLGPQDQLQIRVSDLRSGAGEAYQWQTFSNTDFIVGPTGRLSLPIIGEIEVSGKTTSELASTIASLLRDKAGLAVKPDASVQIKKFRPFYIMGSIDKPGEYEFRPGLNVLQAVSLAGGLQRLNTDALLAFTREALGSRGDIIDLTGKRLALLAQQTRLDAEIRDIPLIFNGELQMEAKKPIVERVIREERQLFENRQNSIRNQIANLNQTKEFLKEESVSLAEKVNNTSRQIDMVKQELDRVSSLVSRGLSAVTRQVDVSQTVAQMESTKLDAEIATIRARQDIARTDRAILEIKDSRRTSALQEAAETRSKLAEVESKLETAKSLLYQSSIRAPAAVLANSDAHSKPDYFILRRLKDKTTTIQVTEEDDVEPGDVVRVQPRENANFLGSQLTSSSSKPSSISQ